MEPTQLVFPLEEESMAVWKSKRVSTPDQKSTRMVSLYYDKRSKDWEIFSKRKNAVRVNGDMLCKFQVKSIKNGDRIIISGVNNLSYLFKTKEDTSDVFLELQVTPGETEKATGYDWCSYYTTINTFVRELNKTPPELNCFACSQEISPEDCIIDTFCHQQCILAEAKYFLKKHHVLGSSVHLPKTPLIFSYAINKKLGRVSSNEVSKPSTSNYLTDAESSQLMETSIKAALSQQNFAICQVCERPEKDVSYTEVGLHDQCYVACLSQTKMNLELPPSLDMIVQQIVDMIKEKESQF